MGVPVLQATRIKKTFTTPSLLQILKGIDLAVFPGESVAIMGRSGEGKSTLLNILSTLEKPTEGFLTLMGSEITPFNQSELRNRVLGFIFQSFHLLEDYSPIDNILMPARIARRSTSKNSEAYKRACALLERIGLGQRIHARTKQLSGGEKQRVAIARALLNDPQLILADEPTGNLDHHTALEIHSLLFELVEEQHKSLVIVTHDPLLAGRCHRKFSLEDGKLRPLGPFN